MLVQGSGERLSSSMATTHSPTLSLLSVASKNSLNAKKEKNSSKYSGIRHQCMCLQV